MSQEQILEGNKLIAEFMGAKYHKLENEFGNVTEVMWYLPGNHPNPHCNLGSYRRLTELEYNVRWDWLMPVVEKIAKMELTYENADEKYHPYPVTFGMIDDYGNFMVRIFCNQLFVSETLIESAWKAVVDFIKGHNQNSTL